MNTLKFSKVISGCMSWGAWGKQQSTSQMTALIEFCAENEITSFDHADIYGDYSTEAEFGNALKNSSVKREDIQLITKCGIQYMGISRQNKVKHYDYSKDYIIWSAEQSLKSLRTDYLDAFLLHRPSPLMHPQDVMEAMDQLIKEGKVLNFGVSNFTPSQMMLIADAVPVKLNQIEFSLTQFEAMHNGTLDYMFSNAVMPMAWSPLGNVFKDDTEQTRRIHKQLGELIEKYNVTEDQLLLAWIMKHPSGIIPVVGTTDKRRLINAKNASTIDLEIDDWFLMLVASQGHKVP